MAVVLARLPEGSKVLSVEVAEFRFLCTVLALLRVERDRRLSVGAAGLFFKGSRSGRQAYFGVQLWPRSRTFRGFRTKQRESSY